MEDVFRYFSYFRYTPCFCALGPFKSWCHNRTGLRIGWWTYKLLQLAYRGGSGDLDAELCRHSFLSYQFLSLLFCPLWNKGIISSIISINGVVFAVPGLSVSAWSELPESTSAGFTYSTLALLTNWGLGGFRCDPVAAESCQPACNGTRVVFGAICSTTKTH